jgi:hypothetical protein
MILIKVSRFGCVWELIPVVMRIDESARPEFAPFRTPSSLPIVLGITVGLILRALISHFKSIWIVAVYFQEIPR